MPHKILTWPNVITFVRLLGVPPFIALMILAGRQDSPAARRLALGVFIFLAISDLADGWLARRLGRSTHLGALLDPIADKLLITSAVVLLALPGIMPANPRLPVIVLIFIIGKDLYIALGAAALYLVAGQTRFRPGPAGKATTAAQVLMVTAMLLGPDAAQVPGYQWFVVALWWLAAALAALTAASYTLREVREFRASRDPNRWSARENCPLFEKRKTCD